MAAHKHSLEIVEVAGEPVFVICSDCDHRWQIVVEAEWFESAGWITRVRRDDERRRGQ